MTVDTQAKNVETLPRPDAARIVPLGDRALLVYWATEIEAIAFTESVRQANPPWLEDVVPAYASVGIFFDLAAISFFHVRDWIAELPLQRFSLENRQLHRLPCCYELGIDLQRVAEHTGLSTENVILQHSGTEYTVYAMGFCPGFPYLGYLPNPLCGVPRLPSPRLQVEAGSVGLTGRQTGLYPLVRPGGWNLIGKTPLVIVDVNDSFFPIRVGDRVRFERIDEREYEHLRGERLPLQGTVSGNR